MLSPLPVVANSELSPMPSMTTSSGAGNALAIFRSFIAGCCQINRIAREMTVTMIAPGLSARKALPISVKVFAPSS